jgi:hypothetical protein
VKQKAIEQTLKGLQSTLLFSLTEAGENQEKLQPKIMKDLALEKIPTSEIR